MSTTGLSWDFPTILSAIHAGYVQGRGDAYTYLESMRTSPAAWEIAYKLLNLTPTSPDLPPGVNDSLIGHAHHYGSLVMSQKVSEEWPKVDVNDRPRIRGMIVTAIHNRSSLYSLRGSERALMRRLAESLCIIAIHDQACTQLVQDMVQLASTGNMIAVLRILAELPATLERLHISHTNRENMTAQCLASSEIILRLCDSVLQSCAPGVIQGYTPPQGTTPPTDTSPEYINAMLLLALSALNEWFPRFATLAAVNTAASGCILHVVLRLLPIAPFGDIASSFLASMLSSISVPQPPGHEDALRLCISAIAALGPPIINRMYAAYYNSSSSLSLSSPPSSPSSASSASLSSAAHTERIAASTACLWLCRVTTALGDNARFLIAQASPDAIALVQVQLALVAFPHRPTIAYNALDFFLSLQSVPPANRSPALGPPLFSKLLQILLLQLSGHGHALQWMAMSSSPQASSGNIDMVSAVWSPASSSGMDQNSNPVSGPSSSSLYNPPSSTTSDDSYNVIGGERTHTSSSAFAAFNVSGAALLTEDIDEIDRFSQYCETILGDLYGVLNISMIRMLVACFVGAHRLPPELSAALASDPLASSFDMPLPDPSRHPLAYQCFLAAVLRAIVSTAPYAMDAISSLVNDATLSSSSSSSLDQTQAQSNLTSRDAVYGQLAIALTPLFQSLSDRPFLSTFPSDISDLSSRAISSYSWLIESHIPAFIVPLMGALIHMASKQDYNPSTFEQVHGRRSLRTAGHPSGEESKSFSGRSGRQGGSNDSDEADTPRHARPVQAAKSFATFTRACRARLATSPESIAAAFALISPPTQQSLSTASSPTLSSSPPSSSPSPQPSSVAPGSAPAILSIPITNVLSSLALPSTLPSASVAPILKGYSDLASALPDPDIASLAITALSQSLLASLGHAVSSLQSMCEHYAPGSSNLASLQNDPASAQSISRTAGASVIDITHRLKGFTSLMVKYEHADNQLRMAQARERHGGTHVTDEMIANTSRLALTAYPHMWSAFTTIQALIPRLVILPAQLPLYQGEAPLSLLVSSLCEPLVSLLDVAGLSVGERAGDIVPRLVDLSVSLAAAPLRLIHEGPLNVLSASLGAFGSQPATQTFFDNSLSRVFAANLLVIFPEANQVTDGNAAAQVSIASSAFTLFNVATNERVAPQPFTVSPSSVLALFRLFLAAFSVRYYPTPDTTSSTALTPFGAVWLHTKGYCSVFIRAVAETLTQCASNRDVQRAAVDALTCILNEISDRGYDNAENASSSSSRIWAPNNCGTAAATLVRAIIFTFAGEPQVSDDAISRYAKCLFDLLATTDSTTACQWLEAGLVTPDLPVKHLLPNVRSELAKLMGHVHGLTLQSNKYDRAKMKFTSMCKDAVTLLQSPACELSMILDHVTNNQPRQAQSSGDVISLF